VKIGVQRCDGVRPFNSARVLILLPVSSEYSKNTFLGTFYAFYTRCCHDSLLSDSFTTRVYIQKIAMLVCFEDDRDQY